MVGQLALARQEKQKRLILQQEQRRKKHIYAVGEGLRSEKTAFTYTWHFDTFLKHIQKTEEDLLRMGENPKDPEKKGTRASNHRLHPVLGQDQKPEAWYYNQWDRQQSFTSLILMM